MAEDQEDIKLLPEDLIIEVFSWLPAKSLYKFKCTSKSINELTKHKVFRVKQSQNSLQRNNNSHFFIQPRAFPRPSENAEIEIHPLSSPSSSSSCGVSPRFMHFLENMTSMIIHTSSNGLLLCQYLDEIPPRLYIFNPTTLSCSLIVPFPQRPNFVWCAFECINSKDYKLFFFEKYPNQWLSLSCIMYNPKQRVWKAKAKKFDVGDVRDISSVDRPVFCKGAMHFVSIWSPHYSNSKPYIASYDLESGMSRMIMVPKCIEDHDEGYVNDVSIFKWGSFGSSNESICLVRSRDVNVFNIWVLSDYESNFWSKILSISLEEMGLPKEYNFRGFVVMNGQSLVFGTEKNVYRYDLNGEKKASLKKICENKFGHHPIYFIPYCSTLRPCDIF